jgi:hypothetical protein
VPVDILDEEPTNADAALVAESDLHHKSSHSFFVPAASSSAANAASSFNPIPDNAAIDALGLGPPAVIDHLVEFCHANADIFRGLDA